jgi:FKBP-type peptidyl-prolyl cis-trans isomerase
MAESVIILDFGVSFQMSSEKNYRVVSAYLSAILIFLAQPVFSTTTTLTQDSNQRTSVTLESGVQFQDIVVGTGAEATKGKILGIHYEGKVVSTGKVIDNSRWKLIPTPLRFELGGGKVIRGLDEGLTGMRVGGKRLIAIPPDLAYGDAGVPPEIPPKAWLTFDVELVEVRDKETSTPATQVTP